MSADREQPFQCISVLGPGLIGGSLIRACRKVFPKAEVKAWARRPEVVDCLRDQEGLGNGACHDLVEAVEGADCVVLAMPTGAMADVVRQLEGWPGGFEVLVTDVGSVKGPVEAEVGTLVRAKGGQFIGSHPMAGSEKAGIKFAEAGLFEEAPVILTPRGEDEGSASLERLSSFWTTLGGRVSTMSATEHDQLVASISHLPHLVAAALVRVVLGSNSSAGEFSGGGFRDTTRVSAGPAEMWAGILADNHVAVSEQLGAMIAELENWKEALDSLDREGLRGFLSQARTLRESL